VSGCDRVEVPVEVQVDVPHRIDLGVASAGRASLDAENGSKGRLPQRKHDLLAELRHCLREADGRDGLALTCFRRSDRCNQDQLSILVLLEPLQDVQWDLCLILPIELDVVLGKADLRRNLFNRFDLRLLCNFNVRLNCSTSLL